MRGEREVRGERERERETNFNAIKPLNLTPLLFSRGKLLKEPFGLLSVKYWFFSSQSLSLSPLLFFPSGDFSRNLKWFSHFSLSMHSFMGLGWDVTLRLSLGGVMRLTIWQILLHADIQKIELIQIDVETHNAVLIISRNPKMAWHSITWDA